MTFYRLFNTNKDTLPLSTIERQDIEREIIEAEEEGKKALNELLKIESFLRKMENRVNAEHEIILPLQRVDKNPRKSLNLQL